MTLGVYSRAEWQGQMMLHAAMTHDVLDCLNVFRSMVRRSGVNLNSRPSGDWIVAELHCNTYQNSLGRRRNEGVPRCLPV